MTSVAVHNLSKKYNIYSQPSHRLKEMLLRGRKIYHREFWALRSISLQVDKGSTLGIIGPNGSGKSTLLQLIAGTLQPSTGSVEIEGRVAALLELGSGFNPEHTGRENVYLAASILGIPHEEMKERFPQIERFAEIGEFIDQPVKTYSSGMYVRLAFATAINVDPDILLVDEALAVGDAIFADRCNRRIRQMQVHGVIIILVSHDVNAVKMLCDRAILMDAGSTVAIGDPDSVVNRYQEIISARQLPNEEREKGKEAIGTKRLAEDETFPPLTFTNRHGDRKSEIIAIRLLSEQGSPVGMVWSGQSVRVHVVARANQYHPNPNVGILVRNKYGVDMYGTNSDLKGIRIGPCLPGEMVDVYFEFKCWLGGGWYSISPAVQTVNGRNHDWLDGALFFEVVERSIFNPGIVDLNAQVTVRRRSTGRLEPDKGD